MLRDSERMRRMTGGNTGAASPAPFRKSEVVVAQGRRVGLRKGDVLVSYAGQPLESAQQTVTLIKAHSRDAANVTLVVRRAGEEMEFAVRPGVLGLNMLTRKPGVR
jgi:S1-C subfamily serine protease